MPPEEISLLFRYPSRLKPAGVRRRALGEFLKDIAKRITPNSSITCMITDDRELHELNSKFRRKNSTTDVLSFPSSNGSPGELAISLDRARDQAEEFGHTVEEELQILILHGLLHLAGFDHEADNGQMARVEALWQRKLKLPRGLVERARA